MTLHDIEADYWADYYEKNPTSIEVEDTDFDPETSDVEDLEMFEEVINAQTLKE